MNFEDRKDRPLKIVQLIDHLGSGGAQRWVAEMVTKLERDRFDPVVVALRPAAGLPRKLQESGIRVIELPNGKYHPGKIFALWRLLSRERPDLIHTHLTAARLLGVPAARLAGVKKIFCHEHSSGRPGLKEKLLFFPVERKWVRAAERIFPVSHATARFCLEEKGYPPGKMEVFPTCIDPEPFRRHADRRRDMRDRWGIARDAPLIGSVGRLHAVKGQEFLVRAVPRILAVHPHARLVIVGEGRERENLLRTASRLGVAQALLLPGRLEDVETCYSAFDLFVLPSLNENSSLALLEAAAARCPIIASRVGGIPEFVIHEETGLLVPPRRSQKLAEAVLRLLGDEELRGRLTVGAERLLRRKFDLSRGIQRLQAWYRQSAEGEGQPAPPVQG